MRHTALEESVDAEDDGGGGQAIPHEGGADHGGGAVEVRPAGQAARGWKKHRRADICCEKKPIQWKELSKSKTGALLQICLAKKKKGDSKILTTVNNQICSPFDVHKLPPDDHKCNVLDFVGWINRVRL